MPPASRTESRHAHWRAMAAASDKDSSSDRQPHCLVSRGNSDIAGAVRGVETITTGGKWKRLREPITIVGELIAADREACWDLGATAPRAL
ncbi:conserved hypothetical protein [Parafrankia sp. Ea1.12]|nr:conserved hypothetical protein [Parafrankia sp. Ea1.12]